MIMMPSSALGITDAEIAGYIGVTQHSPVTDAAGRVKLAWDAIGSEFGSCHLQYEMFYAGSEMVTRAHAFRNSDWDRATSSVDRFMSTYDLNGRQTANVD